MADVKITVNKDGPYKVEGDLDLVDHEGRPLDTREGKALYLCRCGQSATKPLCDGTHNDVDFSGEKAAVIEQAYAGD